MVDLCWEFVLMCIAHSPAFKYLGVKEPNAVFFIHYIYDYYQMVGAAVQYDDNQSTAVDGVRFMDFMLDANDRRYIRITWWNYQH